MAWRGLPGHRQAGLPSCGHCPSLCGGLRPFQCMPFFLTRSTFRPVEAMAHRRPLLPHFWPVEMVTPSGCTLAEFLRDLHLPLLAPLFCCDSISTGKSLSGNTVAPAPQTQRMGLLEGHLWSTVYFAPARVLLETPPAPGNNMPQARG